jgi:transcriptional antiterminator RfaH
MPVLAHEPACFPDDLFQKSPTFDVENRYWSVVHTRPRQEKCIARHLRSFQIPYYLPQLSRRRRLRGRTTTSYIPLFPSYVSILCTREERLAAFDSGRAVSSLDVPNQTRFWQDLQTIERLIESGMPITPEDRMGPGDRVVVRSGPLAGLEGTILRVENSRRFLVQVDFIQRGASVLADDFYLEVIN